MFTVKNGTMESILTAFIVACSGFFTVFAGELCTKAPEFKPSGKPSQLRETLGSTAFLNCTALVSWDPQDQPCDALVSWRKDGGLLSNHSLHPRNLSKWLVSPTQQMLNSVLVVRLREEEDFGLYTCRVGNASTDFSLHNINRPSHTAALIASMILLLILTTSSILYSTCHLNIQLWYRNKYGDYEINDGKIYDAYISYVNNNNDRKFVNFILKPHLENKHGHKLHLNNNNILPGSEPSAELLMNVSRCRRLILVLSHPYLEQDWCSNNFRQSLLHVLELSQQLIVIMFEGQSKHMSKEIMFLLKEHEKHLTVLNWSNYSITPSSVFWKKLALAMPRSVVLHSHAAGDPQTLLQDDKDPMLTLNPDYLDCRPDPDPSGDLGVRVPVCRALTSRAPALPAAPAPATKANQSDIDVSDLGSRNYGAPTDFYRLVTDEDV
ncbi:single Ig IL-1-related receptor [Osmerus eperlanus]|uniref:single Ig IL-1-related receptor n=1 Tax=Osmerus eperlanus TaxID=29151 RepID=UPI002E0E1851